MSDIAIISETGRRTLAAFDAVIDVRSPSEFAEDHIPGAINLPVLDDEERARVGTIYVQEQRFRARRIGAALIAKNVAQHLEAALADKPASFRPLIYCWRGGMRSHAMATILSQIGWRTTLLKGGYKTYRRRVKTLLYDEPLPLNLILLDGRTGSGKTELLTRLAQHDVQILDLEALAEHRGSVFGAIDRPQPTQKLFESRLAAALEALEASHPVLVEAESSKVGDRMIPPSVWETMCAAPRIEIAAPLEARVRYLVDTYASSEAHRDALAAALERVPGVSVKTLARWRTMIEKREVEALAIELLEKRYDPAYDRSARRDVRTILGRIVLSSLTPSALDSAADEIARIAKPPARPPTPRGSQPALAER